VSNEDFPACPVRPAGNLAIKFFYFSLQSKPDSVLCDFAGKVNSLFGVCESLMPLVYGPMYSAIYAATMNTFPGTFFIAGGCMTMPAVFAFL
jgi:hypothetical protein